MRKSACQVDERQLKVAERLENTIGLISIEAVRLLQARSSARTDPTRPEQRVVPSLWAQMLCRAKNQQPCSSDGTEVLPRSRELGGFLGRKCDGEPGWVTIWRG